MADPTPQNPAAPPDAGFAFRAEMAFSNFMLTYWKTMLGIVGVALLGTFAYGQYTSYVASVQQEVSAKASAAQYELFRGLLPKLDEQTRQMVESRGYSADIIDGMLRMISPLDDETKGKIGAAADALAAIARESSGPAAAQAAVDAAELFVKLERAEDRKAMLEIAAREGNGPVRHGAHVALANLEIGAGSPDAGIARLRDLVASSEGFLAEDASYLYTRALHDAGRAEDLAKAAESFLAKWPESKRAAEVRGFQSAPAVTPAPEAPAPPPAEATAAEAVPAAPAAGEGAAAAPTETAPAAETPAAPAGNP